MNSIELTEEWLSSLTLEDLQNEARSQNEESNIIEELSEPFSLMAVDSRSPELSRHDKSLQSPNFQAKKRSENTVVTPSRYTSLKPRGVSSPIKTGIPCRKLDFDI